MKNKAHLVTTAQVNKDRSSSSQQKFQQLFNQVTLKKAELADLEAAFKKYQQAYINELLPLEKEFDRHQEEMIYLLDGEFEGKNYTKAEKILIHEVISNMVGNLISKGKNDKLEKIYNKYNFFSLEEEKAMMQEECKDWIKRDLGIDLGEEIDFDNPEVLIRKLAETMKERMANQGEGEDEYINEKSKKDFTTQKRDKRLNINVQETIKSIYRQLILYFHPDGEQDEQEKDRKTELMKELNTAYRSKDLMLLLELQVKAQLTSADKLGAVSSDKILHYNIILKEQLNELLAKILGIKHMFEYHFSLKINKLKTPKKIINNLQYNKKMLQENIQSIKGDLLHFKKSHNNIKHFLKFYRTIF